MTHDCCLLPSAWLTGLCGDGWLKSLHTTELHLSLTQHLPRKLFFLGTSQQSFLSHVHVTLCQQTAGWQADMVIVKCLVISTDCWCSLCTAQVLLSCPHNVLETVTPVQILTSHHRLVRSRSQTGLSVVPPPLGPGPGRLGTLDIAPCAGLGLGQRGGCVHFTICFVPQLSSSDQIQHWYCVLNHLLQFYSM